VTTQGGTSGSGLVGHWKLNETSGTTASDSSGNGNHGSVLNSGIWTAGKIGGALSVDGVNDYVNVPSSVNYDSTTGTWAFWMKTDGVWGTDNSYPQNRAVIASRHDGSGSRNGLFILQWPATGGWLNVHAYNSSTGVCSLAGPAARDNLWHHIVITYSRANGGQIVLYKDGVQSGSCTNSAAWNFNSQAFRLGDSSDTFWEEWKGTLDDVRIYNRILSPQEITNLY
jgi:hypothetical protein